MNYRKRTNSNKIIFSTGAFLFLIGFLGMIYNFWINPSDSASDFLPTDTIILGEFKTSPQNIEKFGELGFLEGVEQILAKNLPNVKITDLQPWLGKKIAFAWLPDKDFVFAGKYRSKNFAKKFIKKLLVPEEELVEKNFAGFTVYSPSFSSEMYFVFKDKWLIIASSKKALESILDDKPRLAQNSKFKEISRDLSGPREILGYVNFEKLVENGFKLGKQKPLFKALAKTVPAFGLELETTNDELKINSKFLTTKGVFSTELLQNTPHEIIPELAQYAPKDVLFFLNGYDLHAKYSHTKKFLEETHPQFALIFDGVLRAGFKKLLGENFDFQKDFLEKIHGQYALILNFADKENPFTYFTLITGFGESIADENNKKLQEIIKNAQQKYSTKVIEHKLPDGSIRQELVIVDSEKINIKEKEFQSNTYYTTETKMDDEAANPQQKFSYGFLNGFLVFSNHENGVRDVLKSFASKVNLTQNNDFRENILFNLPASENYGFVNNNKLKILLKSKSDADENSFISESELRFLLEKFRTISLAKKTFTDATNLSVILRKR